MRNPIQIHGVTSPPVGTTTWIPFVGPVAVLVYRVNLSDTKVDHFAIGKTDDGVKENPITLIVFNKRDSQSKQIISRGVEMPNHQAITHVRM